MHDKFNEKLDKGLKDKEREINQWFVELSCSIFMDVEIMDKQYLNHLRR